MQARNEKVDYNSLTEILRNLRDNMGVNLSQRSKSFLNLKTDEERNEFSEKYKNEPLTRNSNIVAMAQMKKNIQDDKGISVLIICTEEKDVIIVDVSAFTVLKQIR
jgi:Bardet-Biedl syndrome 1 protein